MFEAVLEQIKSIANIVDKNDQEAIIKTLEGKIKQLEEQLANIAEKAYDPNNPSMGASIKQGLNKFFVGFGEAAGRTAGYVAPVAAIPPSRRHASPYDGLGDDASTSQQ